MKLGKISWLIIVISAAAIAFGSLAVVQSHQTDEYQVLEEELALASTRLSKIQLDELTARKGELEPQLDEALAALQLAKDNISPSNESINVTDALFVIARSCDVVINDIRSSDLSGDEMAGVPSSVIQLAISAEGEVSSLISYVIALNRDFTTGIVTSVDINIPEEETATANTSLEEPDLPSASIRLSVYSYQGD